MIERPAAWSARLPGAVTGRPVTPLPGIPTLLPCRSAYVRLPRSISATRSRGCLVAVCKLHAQASPHQVLGYRRRERVQRMVDGGSWWTAALTTMASIASSPAAFRPAGAAHPPTSSLSASPAMTTSAFLSAPPATSFDDRRGGRRASIPCVPSGLGRFNTFAFLPALLLEGAAPLQRTLPRGRTQFLRVHCFPAASSNTNWNSKDIESVSSLCFLCL